MQTVSTKAAVATALVAGTAGSLLTNVLSVPRATTQGKPDGGARWAFTESGDWTPVELFISGIASGVP